MWAFFYFHIGIHHSGTAMLRHEMAQRLSHRSVSRFVFFMCPLSIFILLHSVSSKIKHTFVP